MGPDLLVSPASEETRDYQIHSPGSLIPDSSHPLADLPPPHQDMGGSLRMIADGFQLGQVFYAALDLDLFSYLQTPTSLPDLARMMHADPDLLTLIAGVLVNCGILEKHLDRVVVRPDMAPFLLPSSPYYAHYLTHASMQRHFWQNLHREIRSRREVHHAPPLTRDTPDSVAYTGRTALLGRLQATMHLIRRETDTRKPARILDLGGGHGLFSVSCAQEFPDASIVLIDRPDICHLARQQISHARVADRVEIREQDFMTDSLGGPYDLILDLGAFGGSREQLDRWFLKISQALRSGGLYIRSSFTLDDCLTGPLMTLLFEIEEIVSGRNQRHLTNGEIITLLSAQGFNQARVEDMTERCSIPLRLITARKGQ